MQDAPRHDWPAFVRSVTRNATQPAISRKTGIDQGTISRWLNDERSTTPSARGAVTFARAYGLNVIDTLIVAGIISEDDTKRRARIKLVELVDVATDELIAELGRRAELGAA